jgi:hypothetical protein
MIHAGPGIAAIAFAATLAEISAQPQIQTEPSGRTVWDHNGSVMYLVANGASREIYYQKPRPGMWDAGARPGSLLFRGQVNSGQYSGSAYIFNPNCGPIAFEVKGASLDGDERIMLTGQAPRVGRNCRSYGSYTSTLEFRRAKPDEAVNHSQEALATPPLIASKPELKADVPPTTVVKYRAHQEHSIRRKTQHRQQLRVRQRGWWIPRESARRQARYRSQTKRNEQTV